MPKKKQAANKQNITESLPLQNIIFCTHNVLVCRGVLDVALKDRKAAKKEEEEEKSTREDLRPPNAQLIVI